MSNLQTQVRIVAKNDTAQGLNEAVSSVQNAGQRMVGISNNMRAQLESSFQQIQNSFNNGMNLNAISLQEVSNKAKQVFEQTRTPLEQLKSKQQELNQLFEMGAIDADTYARALNKIDGETKELNQQNSKLFGALNELKSAFAGLSVLFGAQHLVQTADAMQSLNNQIRQVTASDEEFVAVQQQVLEVANRTTSDLQATGDLYVKTSRALKDYGYSQQEVLTFVEATNNAMALGGVAAEQQSAALMQLAQALGSGVLQGDEFKSIAEAAPILLDTIAEYMGKSRAEVKKLGSEGELTADVIFKAISGAAEKFAEQAGKLPVTFGSALTVLQNNWKSFVDNLMNGSGIMTAIANVVMLVANNLRVLAQAFLAVGVAFFMQQLATLSLTVTALGGAFQALWGVILANPIVAVAAAIAAVLVATGELENAMDALGVVASDVLDLIGTGFQGLADLVAAVYGDMTQSADTAAADQSSIFGNFFDDCGNGFYGLLEMAGKVMDGIAAFIVATCVAGANAFGNMWNAVVSGAVSATNAAIAQVESMINAVINGINRLISMVNSIGGSVASIGEVSLGRVDGGGAKVNANGKGFLENHAETFSAIQNSGMGRGQTYARSIRQRSIAQKSGGGGGVNLAQRGTNRAQPLGGGSGGGRGGGGRKGGGSGRKKGGGGRKSGSQREPRDTRLQDWSAELEKQKLAYQEQQLAQGTHEKWSLNSELKYWQDKLKLVDANSKIGIDIRQKIYGLQLKLHDDFAKAEEQRIGARTAAKQHEIAVEQQQAEQMLANGKIQQTERLDMEMQFEQRKFDIVQQAIRDRIALAKADPDRDPEKLAQLHEQLLELERQFQLKKSQLNHDKETHRRKENPTLHEMLQDGKKNIWTEAQNQMEQAFSAMLSRTQSFREAMGNLFQGIGQMFIKELVTKPLMAEMMKYIKTTSLYQMMFGQQVAMQGAASSAIMGAKAAETTSVVTANAVQAASGAAASQASIPFTGPVLAIAAMGAVMGAVMGLLGGGNGSKTTTTTTRIPSAAGGWDIPAGLNPLTQLHEQEMVLPAEHANTIRGLASGGGGEPIVINATGGDFIHKNDLAKLLKQLNRDFKFK